MSKSPHKFSLHLFFFALVSVILLISACGKEEMIPPVSERGLVEGVAYGPDLRQTLDILLPENRDENTPVVFILHGGAWTTGNKGLEYVRKMRTAFADTGMAAVALNYRLASGNPDDQMQDILAAMDTVTSRAGEWSISPVKFGLIGFGSGGHLALLYAHGFQDPRVRTVISLAGAVNLADSNMLVSLRFNDLEDDLQEFIGGSIAQDSLGYHEASPINYLAPVPTFLMHGLNDPIFPVDQSLLIFDSLDAGGGWTDTTIFNSKAHDLFQDDEDEDRMLFEAKAWMTFFIHF